MQTKEVTDFFKNISYETKGFEGWLHSSSREEVFERLSRIEDEPLTKVQLNQLLLLSLEAGISDGFFKYYWLSANESHTYDTKKVDDYHDSFTTQNAENSISSIVSLQHLRWGINRIYIDCLLYFGNIKNGYRELRSMTEIQLINFFNKKRIKTEIIQKRGSPLNFMDIGKDDRYLISEMAFKMYGDKPKDKSELLEYLITAYKASGSARVKIKDLLDNKYNAKGTSIQQLEISTDEILEIVVNNEDELRSNYARIAEKFIEAREAAKKNTNLYLSLVNDLDVYVATSMRTRNDFRIMADNCKAFFENELLKHLHLRYFDPTISAADSHEDKGLIECLMVKCAKVLVYCAGDKESYGKDAEAAMALSLGKPVIFYCDPKTRAEFYKFVHPLSRLIDFSSGVAVGAIVTENRDEIPEILLRIFNNKMEYKIDQPTPGYYKLIDKLTDSVVRIQTNYELLEKSFWTYYHTSHE